MYSEYVEHYRGYAIETIPRKGAYPLYRAYKVTGKNGKHFIGANGKRGYMSISLVKGLIDTEERRNPINPVSTGDLNAIERIAIVMQGILPSVKPDYVAKAAINAYVTATGKELHYDYEVINGLSQLIAPLYKPHKMKGNSHDEA